MTALLNAYTMVLIAILVSMVIWFARSRARAAADARIRQLDEAAELLAAHAGALERFLDTAEAPIEIKRLLVWFSDAMADRDTAAKLARWASSRPFGAPFVSAEAEALSESLSRLLLRQPDLVDDFTTAILSATAGASLRWPESAALFDQMFSRLVTTPKRDVAIAITATRFQAGGPFSMPTASAAAA